MVKRATNHHIVPQVLQKQFAINADPERIYRSKRGADGKFSAPKMKKIEKAFVLRNYYTILENDLHSDRVEREFYGNLDNYLGELVPNIVTSIKKGKTPQFTKPALDSFRLAVMEMIKRTPDFMREYDGDETIGREVFKAIINNTSETDSHRELHLSTLKNPQKLIDYGRSIRVKATLDPSTKTEEVLEEFTTKWAIINSKHSFILSSMMAYRIGNGGPNGLSNPNTEIWMPISPTIAAVLIRDPHNKIPDIVPGSRDQIRKMNEYAVKNSFEIASHSEQLLRSLLGYKN